MSNDTEKTRYRTKLEMHFLSHRNDDFPEWGPRLCGSGVKVPAGTEVEVEATWGSRCMVSAKRKFGIACRWVGVDELEEFTQPAPLSEFTFIGFYESTGQTYCGDADGEDWVAAARKLDVDPDDLTVVEVLEDGLHTYITNSVCPLGELLATLEADDVPPPATGECGRCGHPTHGVDTALCGDCELDAERDERAISGA